MKHISDLTHSTSIQRSEPASIEVTEKDKLIIKELFVLMKATWGNKYTSQFKDANDIRLAMRVWLQHFAGINRDIMLTALTRLGKRLEWPPTIQQMTEEVKTIRREQATIQTALPRPARKRTQKAAQALDSMKKILHG